MRHRRRDSDAMRANYNRCLRPLDRSGVTVSPLRRHAVLAALVLAPLSAAGAYDGVAHRLEIVLDPQTHGLAVRDTIVLPASLLERPEGIELLLGAALRVTSSDPAVEPVGEIESGSSSIAINGSKIVRTPACGVRRYRLKSPPHDATVVLSYEGSVDFGLSDAVEEYTRGFRETAGIMGPEGVYLAGDGFWYPQFGEGLIGFAMEIAQPAGWHVVSEGRGTSRGDDGKARWESEGPVDDIHLVGGPLVVYHDAAGAIETWVYLREPDDALASKYLTATSQYLEMYRALIGPYPYSKFALVENFWETGYGMPSFTLLGPSVIRFPFILTSSYPHEILHNWWGNSVFVDAEGGNWSEGLTAYMADHLLEEQRGNGAGYRRDTLQKYGSYVSEGRDFPLREFQSRHSAATEAVGYGKSMMGFHMLRMQLGDATFRDALARFYRTQRGQQASFADLEASFESAAGLTLDAFFEQWLARTGAPSLTVTAEAVRSEGDGWVVRGTLRQVQTGEPYTIRVPVVVDTPQGPVSDTISMLGESVDFSVRTAAPPSSLRVDPSFDLFRLLDPRETPPSIGQLFGAPAILAVLPSSDSALLEGYRRMLDSWRSESHAIEAVLDTEIETLPRDRSIWILGRRNRYAERSFGEGRVPGLRIDDARVDLAGQELPVAKHSFVVIRRHPENVEEVVGWMVVDPSAAFEGMGRKLPHYGKYSYLAFEGDAPDNVAKGQWPIADSPLVVDLRPEDERDRPLELAPLPPRAALAELPPVFSQSALAEHVRYLSSEALEGRGLGTAGLDQAAAYVADRFRAAGLVPGGDDGSYYQRFEAPEGPGGKPVEVANVIGYLPGSRSEWARQTVVLSAHYDHLGLGWPDAYAGNEGRIHPGADDNASGVAVLLELAKSFAGSGPPPRTLVFAAFTGEEAGRVGSRHFVQRPGSFALDGVRAVINLDTVGRLGRREVSVLGTGTAEEWPHVFRGVSYVTGVASRNVPDSTEASDQMSFIERGVPAVQIFTDAHADYHRPGDTADKVDAAGLVRIAAFVKEATVYLTEREEPLTITIPGAARAPAAAGVSGGRSVLFGTVPEFGYSGPGVQVASVIPGSPAERAGLRSGDVVIRIDDAAIADLRAFSELLKTLTPGQSVEAVFLRQQQEHVVVVTVEAR
jgi:hypothetical protein